MHTCPSCGAVSKSAERCDNCGFEFAQTQQASGAPQGGSAFCGNCGSPLPAGARFCGSCGTPVGGTSAPSPAKNKTFLVAAGAVIVVVAVIAITQMLVKEKPKGAAPDTATQTEGTQQGQQADMPRGPSPEQLQLITQLKSQVASNPSDTTSLLQLANTLYDVDNAKEAIPYYVKYLDVSPKNVDARVDYAYCLFRSGDNDKAIAEIKSAIKQNPKHQAAYFNLGIVYLSLGNMEEGAANLRKCIEIDSTSRAGRQASMLMTNHSQMFQKQQ